MKFDKWTAEENAILQQYYSEGAQRCAEMLPGRTLHAIRTQAKKMRLKVSDEARSALSVNRPDSERGKRKWTPEEDAILAGLYNKITYSELCAKLPGRTAGAIYARARGLGLCLDSQRWSEYEDSVLRENYCRGIDYVSGLLPNRTTYAIKNRACKLKIHSAQPGTSDAWTLEEVALLRRYYPLGLSTCSKNIPSRSQSSIVVKARKLGLVVDKDPIVINGIKYNSVQQVCRKYNLSVGAVYRLAQKHSVSTTEALKKCVSGEWSGNPHFHKNAFSGDFGALGEIRVKSALSSFPGMVLCACARCNTVHLISEVDLESFNCEVDGEGTLYPEFCFVPYYFKKMAERAGIKIRNPGTQRYKL